MESSTKHQSLAISDHSLVKGTQKAIKEWLTSLQQDSRVSLSQVQEKGLQKMTPKICGQPLYRLSKQSNQKNAFWKTFQCSFLSLMDILEPSCVDFPKQGMMQNGVVYQQESMVPPISGNDCGYMPTPRAVGIEEHWETIKERLEKTGIGMMNVRAWLEKIGTIQKESQQIHPEYYEWLMGWPIGETDLKPLGMDKSLYAQRSPGKSYQEWYEANIRMLEKF